MPYLTYLKKNAPEVWDNVDLSRKICWREGQVDEQPTHI